MELVLFRLVQECLTNVHRHSHSKIASIRMARESSQITLDIRDEDKGLLDAENAKGEPFGLECLSSLLLEGVTAPLAEIADRIRNVSREGTNKLMIKLYS